MTTTENITEIPADHPADGELLGTEAAAAAAKIVPQMDLSEAIEAAIRKAVSNQLSATAKTVAEGVLGELLTDEVLAGMRETAILEATAAIDPIPAPEPEPEPEPAAEQAPADEEAEEEPAPQLRFENARKFVEGYVVEVYAREVIVRGSEQRLRWCPQWWEHAEVMARMEVLWRAFEHLRQGKGAEPSEFWLLHLDPHMSRILDPEGPFKYCTVAGGHVEKLQPLPTGDDAPAATFPSGYYERPSGLFVREATPSKAAKVPTSWEFP
ncbi:DUF4913 domain-containing protein [Nocardia alba]|uniref:Uncharacterized protein DUF4913 n=1 Tax=Nocardia alba TaxID=225051 RepID=A0A4R1F2V7_9NOCA|nr:DUF4913 domain-containing protein [Nocardia alba]TCJ88113.1 uncharacterized protein DUF4913 [Nocardia alba]